MVGFKPDGTIQNIEVLEQKETPGLGTKMKDEKFLSQFRDKNPSNFNLKVSKDGGEVDALTGATITSRAFGEAVQMAYNEFMKNNTSLIEFKN
jgi:electron transport complex protein RnfG